jgi:AAA domain
MSGQAERVARLAGETGLRLTWPGEYGDLGPLRCVVAGLIEAGTLAVLYGEANTGKSTIALDMALAVARGETWCGRRTRRGVVVWLALESAGGLRRRVVAYATRHGISAAKLPFADITDAVCLLGLDDAQAIVEAAQEAQEVTGEACSLIVIDTVARALCASDENAGADMGALIRACDLIRQETGAAVLLIHHSGKDSARGARGHSSLRAAVDTEIEVSGQANPRQAKVTKQRDLPSGDCFAFDLEPVELGRDPETGDAITACVVVHRDDVAARRNEPRGSNQQAVLGAVRQWTSEHGEIIATPQWHQLCKAQEIRKEHWSRIRKALVDAGWLAECVGGVRYVP